MDSRKGLNKRKFLAAYAASLVVVVACLAVVANFTLRHFINLSRIHATNEGFSEVRQNAEALKDFMVGGIFSLESAAQFIERLVSANADREEIRKFLESETEIAAKNTSSLSGSAFAYIDGTFIHGGNWLPSEGFVPTRRPWYKDAIRAHGRVVVGKPFMGSKSTSPLVSFSKSLQDKKSVVVFTFPLISINRFLSSRQKNDGEIWMVMDRDGLVIASSGEIRQGFNCLSSEAWGMDEEKLAREILLAGEKPFDFVFNGKKYMVFSSIVLEDWHVVQLREYGEVYAETTGIIVRCLFAGLFLFVTLVLFCSIAFWRKICLARTVNMKSEFLKSVAQELLTPLNGILGMTRILLRELRDENHRAYVKDVQRASVDLLSTVRDIKEIAKIESEGLVLEPVQYDLYSVLKDCFDSVSPKATAKNLHFSLECDPDIPSSLWGDEERLRRIIVNLLSNSIMFTEVGEVRLIVGYDSIPNQTAYHLDESINLKIMVKDSGMGARDENPDMFLGLFQLFESKKDESSRFSLDLTRQMIDACGGELVVKSRYGEGASYLVSIPQLVLNVEPMGDFAYRYKNDSVQDGRRSDVLFAPGARILAVDDAELNLKVIRGLLKETRVQIDTAQNGSQCLDMVRVRHYDLILLDNLMPMMDGRETYERMKRLTGNQNKDTPVIILVAGALPVDKDSYLSVGFTDYIPKPLKEEDLIRALKWYLPKHLILTREDLKLTSVFEQPGKTSGLSSEKNKNSVYLGGGIHRFDRPKSIAVGKKKVREIVGDLELDMVSTPKPDEKMLPFKDFLNVAMGMEYCVNDDGLYREMLEEFVQGDKRKEIEAAYLDANWSDYQLMAHSVKSTAHTIGAEELSEEAKSLELACKEGYIGYVRQNHDRVMNLYGALILNIRHGLES